MNPLLRTQRIRLPKKARYNNAKHLDLCEEKSTPASSTAQLPMSLVWLMFLVMGIYFTYDLNLAIRLRIYTGIYLYSRYSGLSIDLPGRPHPDHEDDYRRK